MLHVTVFISVLREVVRPEVLRWLRNPDDPNYHPFRELIQDPLLLHLRRVVYSACIHGPLIVMLVAAPSFLCTLLVPSLFPLNLRFSDPFTEIPADLLLFHFCVPFTLEHCHPRAKVKSFLRFWLSHVGSALDLTKYIFPSDPATPTPSSPTAHPDPQASAVAEASSSATNSTSQEDAPAAAVESASAQKRGLLFRVATLVGFAWLTIAFVTCVALVLPVSVGRLAVWCLSLPLSHDVYTFGLGGYTIWGCCACASFSWRFIRTHRLLDALSNLAIWTGIAVKCAALLVLWVGVIPYMAGSLFEIALMLPIRVRVDQTPVRYPYQDWALGLLSLKIWVRLEMVEFWREDGWKIKFEQVMHDGFRNINFSRIVCTIVFPVFQFLAICLSIPYAVSHGLIPCLVSSPVIHSAIDRFCPSFLFLLYMLLHASSSLREWLLEVHDSIRDERYLVGKKLHNFSGGLAANNGDEGLVASGAGLGDALLR